MPVSEAAAAAILPWAREHHREKYDQTLKVASSEKFPLYLARLVELRWKEEPSTEWLRHAPLSLLEQTSISIRARLYGHEIVVAGVKVKDRSWSFAELRGLMMAETDEERRSTFEELRLLKETFDMTVQNASNG